MEQFILYDCICGNDRNLYEFVENEIAKSLFHFYYFVYKIVV